MDAMIGWGLGSALAADLGRLAQCWMMPPASDTRSPLRKSGVDDWLITWVLPSSMRRVTR